MTIEIRPMRPSDLPARERIMSGAFAHGLRPLIYPNGQTDEDLIHSFTEDLKVLENKMSHSNTQAGQRCMVAYDTSVPSPASDFEFPKGFKHKGKCEISDEEKKQSKRVVAISIWQLQPHARTQKDLDDEAAEGQNRSVPPSANAALLSAFGKALASSRAEHVGTQPYLYLKVLAVDPTYQRRGVGKKLLDWGMRIADELGVMAYLEASEMGRGLYAVYGLGDRGVVKGFDVREFGAKDGEHMFMCMLRPASGGVQKELDGVEKGEGHAEQGGQEVVVEKAE